MPIQMLLIVLLIPYVHFSASMGHEDVFHLLMDYNQYITHVRNERGQTPMEAARSTGQVRLVKTIQQRLQVRSNEEHPYPENQ